MPSAARTLNNTEWEEPLKLIALSVPSPFWGCVSPLTVTIAPAGKVKWAIKWETSVPNGTFRVELFIFNVPPSTIFADGESLLHNEKLVICVEDDAKGALLGSELFGSSGFTMGDY